MPGAALMLSGKMIYRILMMAVLDPMIQPRSRRRGETSWHLTGRVSGQERVQRRPGNPQWRRVCFADLTRRAGQRRGES